MHQRAAALMGVVALCVTATPALAAPSAYDTAFVAAFEAACVPGRLSYQATKDAALAAGWSEVASDSNPELESLLLMSEAAVPTDPEMQAHSEMVAYGKDIDGQQHHLVVIRTSAVISAGEAPFVQVGCYLYNFDAAVAVDPKPVTALIGNPISSSQEQGGAIIHVWGPGCGMPRTFDTQLGFIAEGSEASSMVSFSGTSLNFSTSEPAPGEVVPETYC